MGMLFAAGMVIGVMAMRPKCPAPAMSTTAAVPQVTMTKVPEPMAIASFATPTIASAGRNVFAFASLERPPRAARRETTAPQSTEAVAAPVVTPPQVPARAPQPDYLGAFGPQDTPVLVYRANGDVVNVPLRKP